jgi:hypothetical protein
MGRLSAARAALQRGRDVAERALEACRGGRAWALAARAWRAYDEHSRAVVESVVSRHALALATFVFLFACVVVEAGVDGAAEIAVIPIVIMHDFAITMRRSEGSEDEDGLFEGLEVHPGGEDTELRPLPESTAPPGPAAATDSHFHSVEIEPARPPSAPLPELPANTLSVKELALASACVAFSVAEASVVPHLSAAPLLVALPWCLVAAHDTGRVLHGVWGRLDALAETDAGGGGYGRRWQRVAFAVYLVVYKRTRHASTD